MLLGASGADAGYSIQTFQFTDSNELSGLAPYGRITIESNDGGATTNGLVEGRVRFTVEAFDVYGGTGKNFGWSTLGFNTSLDGLNLVMGTNVVNIDPTATLHNNHPLEHQGNLSQYGSFDWVMNWTPSTKQPTLTFEIITDSVSDATIANFTQWSQNGQGGQGSAFFAGHILDFDRTQGQTSHFVGVVPAPPSIILAGVGVIGLGGFARLRRRFTKAG